MDKEKKRGFAAMTRDQHRKIASKGGVASHMSGKTHEWNSEEARAAGRKGANARRKAGKA